MTGQRVLVEVHRLDRLSSYLLGAEHPPRGPVLLTGPRGKQLGWIRSLLEAEERPFPECLPASPEDLRLHQQRRLFAAEVVARAGRVAQELGLKMRMEDGLQSLDGEWLVLYFSSPGRVDFRPLVKVLGAEYRKKIELYQVSPRQRSQMQGGIGRCGLECCCTAWMQEFPATSLRMAQEQGFRLQPEAISGVCGRLLCCLRFEYEQFLQGRVEPPQIGDVLEIPEGKVVVLAVDPATRTLRVKTASEQEFSIPWGREKSSQTCRSCQKGTERRS